jgi:hypothetical protein
MIRSKDEFFRGCFTTLQSPIDSQPSGLNAMNRNQSVERRNGQLARLWHQYSGMRVVLFYIDYLEKGQTTYYIALLERLNDEIKKKRLHLKKTKVMLHQDKAPVHKSIKTTAKLHALGCELLPHTPFFPDLASSDCFF